jgi:hypothetical protein
MMLLPTSIRIIIIQPLLFRRPILLNFVPTLLSRASCCIIFLLASILALMRELAFAAFRTPRRRVDPYTEFGFRAVVKRTCAACFAESAEFALYSAVGGGLGCGLGCGCGSS